MAPEVLMSDDYNELADIWSLGITAYELAIGEPPHAKLHSMRAALKIPMSPPPTLPDPTHWSQDFHSFLASCLVKDFNNRPSAAQLLSHPFISKAPPHHVLQDIVNKSMQYIDGKAQHGITTADVINNPTLGNSVKKAKHDEGEEGEEGGELSIGPNIHEEQKSVNSHAVSPGYDSSVNSI
jgi:serine/threonine protein kinase